MLKVKIFDEEHEKDLEEEINKFLKELDEKCFADLKYAISAFPAPAGEQIYCYSALILYRENKK